MLHFRFTEVQHATPLGDFIVLSFRMVFFYLLTTGWIFEISLLCENSIIQLFAVSHIQRIDHAES